MTDEEGNCTVKIISTRPGNYQSVVTIDEEALKDSPVDFDFLSGGKWHIDNAEILDINKSKGAELPSLSLDSYDYLYAAWVEGNASVDHYYVKKLDSDGWSRLGTEIDKDEEEFVKGIVKPLLRVNPSDDIPFVRYRLGEGIARDKQWSGVSWDRDVECKEEILWYANMAFSQDGKRTDSHMRYDKNNNKVTFVSAVKKDDDWDVYDNLTLSSVLYKRSHLLIKNDGRPFVVFEKEGTDGLPEAEFFNYSHDFFLSRYVWNRLGSQEGICFSSVIGTKENGDDTYDEVTIAYHDNSADDAKIKVLHYNVLDDWEYLDDGNGVNGAVSPDGMGGISSANESNQCVSLTKDSRDTLYVAWQHADHNGKRSIHISTYVGDKKWEEAAPPLVVEGSIRGPSLVVDSEGIISVAVMYDTTPDTEDMDDVRVYRYNPNEENEE